MTDYRHDLMFGALLEPPAGRPQDVLVLAELMEAVGLDVVTLSDHPYWPERLDTMALLAAIVARTERITVMPNMANLPLRPPTVLARTAATLDILSDGRFELGLATGAQQMWDLIVAEDGPKRDAGQSVEALEEAVRIIRALWASDDAVSFDGTHYRLAGVKPGPRPVHDLGIWLGAYQPRMLRLVGGIADGWVPSSPFLPPEHLPAANQVIDDAALAAGRSPRAVRRGYNIEGQFASDAGSGSGSDFLNGPPGLWAEQLADLALTHGISAFFLYRAESPDFIRRFAEEVAPAVREKVARERGNSAD
ncbi:LLM class flavin-dependent oxidoreductase [Streptomyces liangshanensis]|uniref:LLM class flavin-dependent oxidoreductase n=1 Tax=Streptomyces liangshanensis TaxID=2717324 RepID=A0A6G9GV82_9ACTN|nr:LLM class flavin-dependent oxidoreductase [Streptomyces liangshanensis]QIQ02168.1 LLM class flavin-dependent oxidoreductase [Streptomyces liangshanensis]